MVKQKDFLALRLSSELKQKIVDTAQQQNRTVSNFVKAVLIREVDNNDGTTA